MSSNNFGSFFKSNQQAEQNKRRVTSDIIDVPTRPEYLAALAKYNDWAKTTHVGDAVSPLCPDKKFSELFTPIAMREDGYYGLTLFPWGTTGKSFFDNSWAVVNALLDAFATQRYALKLDADVHARLFDPGNPNTGGVVTSYFNERFYAWDWTAGRLELARWDQSHQAKWMAKHKAIREAIMAIENGYQMSLVLFKQSDVDRWNRNVVDQLDSTVEEALKRRTTDWELAKALSRLSNDNKPDYSQGTQQVGLIVAGIDLEKNPQKVKVVAGGVEYTYDAANPQHVSIIKNALNDKRFSVKLA